MPFTVNITKRDRQRTLKDGTVVIQTRYVLNYNDPATKKRKQNFFERQKDAQQRKADLMASVAMGTYVAERKQLNVRQIIENFLESRSGQVKQRTLKGYKHVCRYITEPLLIGTSEERAEYTTTGKLPKGTRLEPLLGDINVPDLTTAQIRSWYQLLAKEVGVFTARRAKSYLEAALKLAAEDHQLRPPAMPSNLGRGRGKEKKAILAPDQVSHLVAAAQQDSEKGIYYAFPFLTGTRPSEQLALLWEDVDFEKNVIRIRRMQEPDGSITNLTKTVAGTRDIPMCATLRRMMLDWRLRCPRRGRELYRVFPGLGQRQAWPKPRTGGGGPLLYANFRSRIWAPVLKRLGLPYVTPHSARHCFISTLQAQGVEVGLVAKLAGHSNAVVTLGHYTQAVRGGEAAVAALELAFGSTVATA